MNNIISWDDNATPFDFDPNNIPPPPPLTRQVNEPAHEQYHHHYNWDWQPDSNGLLFSHYIDQDGLECMVYQVNHDGTFYWSCNGIGYSCGPIGYGSACVFWRGINVGTMTLDETLTVNWDPNFIPDVESDIDSNIDSDEDDPDP